MGSLKEVTETQAHIEYAKTPEGADNLHEFDENDGYLVDVEGTDRQDLKLAADGHTILVPKPSDDPYDPLNWSRFRKNLLLGIIAATAFLPDFMSATGAPEEFPLAL